MAPQGWFFGAVANKQRPNITIFVAKSRGNDLYPLCIGCCCVYGTQRDM